VSEEDAAPVRPRGRVRWRAAFFVLAGAGVIAAVAWALLGSRLFVVRSVAVTGGTRALPASQVAAVADVPLGTPLSQVDTAAVARRVETIRQVASASVSTSWPDGLHITVRQRTAAVAVRMSGGGYDLVDATGVIVRWSKARPASLPLFATSLAGTALRGDASLATAAAVLRELPAWLSHSVASVTATGPVTLRLRDGKTVVWGGTDRAAEKDRELAILIRDPVRYYDVSAPGTAVTR
jgi:cell division protein FtsQ